MDTQEKVQEFLTWDFAYSFKFKKVEAQFERLWTMKTSARESLKDWLIVSNIAPTVAENCANACSELIENCVKYTKDGSFATVFIHVINNTIIVETINGAGPEDRAALQASLQALQAASDPKEVFIEKLLHPEEGKSQLGLIKIAMETQGTFQIREDDDEYIRLILEIHT